MNSAASAKPTEIIMWHSMAGNLGSEVSELANMFNHSQSNFIVKPLYKGDYNECLTSLAAAFRAGHAPPLVQIFEVGTATMLSPKGIIKPVEQVMVEQGYSLPKHDFFSSVRDYFSEKQQLMAMPFNTSIPVMFYNSDALAKVGYTSDNFPKTWDEFEELLFKLKKEGYKCGYTTANPAWILIESFSALHGLDVIDTNQSTANYNNPLVIRFLERLKQWQNKHYFEYGGRTDDASILFTSGRCPVYSQSSGSYNSLIDLVPFNVEMAAIPIESTKKRYNNVSGGAALWVTQGHSNKVYQGVAQFLSFLSKVEIQRRWHQNTGYLPLGITGYYQELDSKKNHPSIELAKKDFASLAHDRPNMHSRVHNQIRAINEEALEAIFAGLKSPEQAINDAVTRANHALLRFKRNTKD